jgi:GNAT superfamily N-acetyltransferase
LKGGFCLLSIKRAGQNEAEILHKIKNEAFQKDLDTYQDFETNPACESIDQMLYKINASDYYAIYFEDQIIGGVAVQKNVDFEYRISPLYLSPSYQNKGLGTQIINLIFPLYPDARLWTLSTPKPSMRNSHFYEKFGFNSVGEHYINERLTLTYYQKVMTNGYDSTTTTGCQH